MPKLKRLLVSACFETAQRRRQCSRNKGHVISKGDRCLVIKENLADGGTWDTIAGQPTDDSEMALLLARMLADQGGYDSEEARKRYVFWLDSGPFDCGMTVSSGLRGRPNPESQANGAMMRISPLGIFGANHDLQ